VRDSFDDLLKEAKRHRHFENLRLSQAQTLAKAKVEIRIEPDRPQYQLQAKGWYEARTLMIVKLNSDKSLTPLGVYIEHRHPVYGRHLTPCPALDTAQAQEVVTTWGDQKPRIEPYIETAEDIEAIRNRFNSLMAELDDPDDDSL
jgi:hypothetical protein